MGIMDRLRSRETAASNLDFSLADRLKNLAGKSEADPSGDGASETAGPKQAAPSSNGAKNGSKTAEAGAKSQAASSAKNSAIPTAVEEEVVLVAAQGSPDSTMAAKSSGSGNGVSLKTPEPAPNKVIGAPERGKGFFQAPAEGPGHRSQEIQNRSAEIAKAGNNPEGPKQGNIPSFSATKGPGQEFLERVDAAVNRAGAPKENAAGWQAPPEFESIQRHFETDFRSRLDGAMAEFERRFSSQALADDVAEQLEQRIRQAAEKISKEMQSQAWTMHNAVAGELRAFRDQFNKEIQERAKLLDGAALQALQLRESLEAMLPKAEEALRLLSLSEQEGSARLRAASEEFAGQLRNSHQTLSGEIDAKRSALEAAANGFHEDGMRLKEEMESFKSEAASAGDGLTRTAQESIERLNAAANDIQARVREEMEKSRSEAASAGDGLTRTAQESIERLNAAANEIQTRVREETEKSRSEAQAAGDLLSRRTDESFERLNAGANEIQERARQEMDKLAGEIERRILSGGLIEKATEQISGAAQQIVDPAIERMRQAGMEANSTADAVAHTGERVSGLMTAARQEIESKLDQLLNEQLSAVENSMTGFQRKATEELGSVVERIVEESSQQMDERLHVLLQDLFVNASQQINGAARASLGTLHDGLKGVFEEQTNDAGADSGQSVNE